MTRDDLEAEVVVLVLLASNGGHMSTQSLLHQMFRVSSVRYEAIVRLHQKGVVDIPPDWEDRGIGSTDVRLKYQ